MKKNHAKKISDVLKKRMKEVEHAFQVSNVHEKIGDYLVDRIRRRTRTGKGVDKNGGYQNRLNALSERYIQFRKDLLKVNPTALSPDTRPKKSNLTLTGQMLDAIEKEIKRGAKTIIRIFIRPDRKYVDLSTSGARSNRKHTKRKKTDVPTNAEIAKYNEEKGRPFFYLTKPEIMGVKREIRKAAIAVFDKVMSARRPRKK